MVWALVCGWAAGAAVSAGVMKAIGERSPNTIDDSVTGDACLELLCIALWPVFWVAYGSYQLAKH